MVRSDRPLSRKLIRLGFQLLGRSYAHRQDTWPGLSIDKEKGLASWRDRPLSILQPPSAIIPRGLPQIAVVGSGPSLKNQKIDALGHDTAILCNGAALLADHIRPLAVAVEDERFVFRHHRMLAGLSSDIPLLLSPAAMRAWAERDPGPLADRPMALIDNLAKPVGEPRRSLSDPALRGIVIRSRDSAISVAPDKGVVITGTVAFSALQFALASQPQEIILAGVDLSNGDQSRFYESDDKAPSGLINGLDRIASGFELALSVSENRGIKLFCASPASILLGIGYSYGDMLE